MLFNIWEIVYGGSDNNGVSFNLVETVDFNRIKAYEEQVKYVIQEFPYETIRNKEIICQECAESWGGKYSSINSLVVSGTCPHCNTEETCHPWFHFDWPTLNLNKK